MDVLRENLIRARFDGVETKLSLPAVFAGMTSAKISEFLALRPHQRHAWHSFLVQLGAMAMHRAGLVELPTTEGVWRDLLLALTSGEAAATAWDLVAPVDRPALLQPPIPDGLDALKKTISTPDGIDVLITSRNHDLKQAVMGRAEPDDWLFALLTLQTMEGFLGAGNYGISRMNGGFASRPALSIAPRGGVGAHFDRDLRQLLLLRSKVAENGQNAISGGIGLVWLLPWDGTDAIKPAALDPYYIEICRRVRLVKTDGMIVAQAGSSKCARIQPTPGGITGDPWAPLKKEKDGSLKVLTLDAGGFSYRRIVDLIFSQNDVSPSPLQQPQNSDENEGLVLIARGLVRGQGKTEGYHERHVPLSRRLRDFRATITDPIAQIATDRVKMAGEVQRRVLKPALLSLFQNGPDRIDFGHDSSNGKAQAFLTEFDHLVDIVFFDRLWREVDEDTDDDKRSVRRLWLVELLQSAEGILRRVDAAAPKSSQRQYRAISSALGVLNAAPWNNEMLKTWMPEKSVSENQDAA